MAEFDVEQLVLAEVGSHEYIADTWEFAKKYHLDHQVNKIILHYIFFIYFIHQQNY